MRKVCNADYVIDVKGKQKVFNVNMEVKFHKEEQPETKMDRVMVMVHHQAVIRQH